MAKRVSPTAVGTFVIAGVVLIVASIAIFGSGQFFQKKRAFVCFFQGDLNGLKVGAPVKFRGVQIGTVTDIFLRLPPRYGVTEIGLPKRGSPLPVIFELDETQLLSRGGSKEVLRRRGLEQLIKRGLRAQLRMQSILTGLLYIDLAFHPKTPLKLVLKPGTSKLTEIPTTSTTLEMAQQKIEMVLAKLGQIDFAGLVNSLNKTANSIQALASSPALKQAIGSMGTAAASLNGAAIAIRKTVNNVNAKIDPLVAKLTKTSNEADITLKQARAALDKVQDTFAPGSPLTYQMTKTLEDLSGASRSMRQLADYLQRNPSALVRGKYISDTQR